MAVGCYGQIGENAVASLKLRISRNPPNEKESYSIESAPNSVHLSPSSNIRFYLGSHANSIYLLSVLLEDPFLPLLTFLLIILCKVPRCRSSTTEAPAANGREGGRVINCAGQSSLYKLVYRECLPQESGLNSHMGHNIAHQSARHFCGRLTGQ